MRTWESSGRFFTEGLQETHEFTEEVTVWNLVKWRHEIELRPDYRKYGKYNIKQVKRTDKNKNSLVNQFFMEDIAPDRRPEKNEKVGKITKIHQFAEPSPRQIFAELKAWLAAKQQIVNFYKLVV